MNGKDNQALKALQYLFDEGFLHLYFSESGQPMVRLTTELSDVHKAIRVKFKPKNPTDWWKNETKK